MYTIYTKDDCGWCEKAEKLLRDSYLEYELIDVKSDPETLEMFKRRKWSTVPQVIRATFTSVGMNNLNCILKAVTGNQNIRRKNKMDTYQKFIHLSRYARWQEDTGKRESWEETVNRYLNFWGDKINSEERDELFKAISNLEVMPSMRAMWSAGEALTKNNVAGYNCSFVAVDSPRAFDEALLS